ncbi:hypothetical protein DCAR_0102795 [Daucus carota subsp. sativus]|uniref:U-box domain-containing protein n=1 Tax=Daucus carota subsp. sativus TaxID=79200 RepID=A0A162B4T6_DAUCS|nr:PREDICTED: U-box domain-containing protein 21-like [Daucus carota subsp. sativus]WOG83618.1 hypothetical protein DCAR_0102795 [Daucus carota subsp. sativus]
MISSWRKIRRSSNKKDVASMELSIPNHYRCPISLELMKDPVTLSTGITYDRASIETWIEAGNRTCPITNQVLKTLEPIPNHTLRKMIQDWCVDNSSFGIERIPTPRTPLGAREIAEILSRLVEAQQREDARACQEIVAKIVGLAKESERNKQRILKNETIGVLASSFEAFAKSSYDHNVGVLEQILLALTILISSLDGEAKFHLGSNSSLRCMVWLLNSGDLSTRRNAVLVLKHVLSSDQRKMDDFSEIKESLEGLVKVIKEPICPTTTKASLVIIYNIILSKKVNENVVTKFINMGLVERLLEMLVDSEKSICEKALGVLDGICMCNQGRERAYANALTMPVLVKKILRVSDLATEFSVSILWNLSKNESAAGNNGNGSVVLAEAVQVGAFQKLLLLLQFGCSERTKDMASDLLKMLNVHRDTVECVDTRDFRNLKLPA